MLPPAFTQLKTAFTSAPILNHHDPMKAFMIEVNASESGVGAVLSKCFSKKSKLHPMTFFSKKLTPTESNYDIGNWELLAVKLKLMLLHGLLLRDGRFGSLEAWCPGAVQWHGHTVDEEGKASPC